MKKTLISIVICFFAALSSAQNDFENILKDTFRVGAASVSARDEKAKINKATRAYNVAQPKFRFEDAIIQFRISDESGYYDSLNPFSRQSIRGSIVQKATACGAKAGWGKEEMEKEIEEREFFEKNRKHIKVPNFVGEPTIEVPTSFFDITFFTAEKSEDFEFWLGKFWRGIDFSFGKNTVYVGCLVTITDRVSGTEPIVYKVIASASDVDNVAGNVFGGIFGTSAGGSYEADSVESLYLRAFEGAINQLGEVFKYKSAS